MDVMFVCHCQCSPEFPGITGSFGSRPGKLGVDSVMALPSGGSGTTGFAFGTVGNKKNTHKLSLGKMHALNHNDLLYCIGKNYFYYLLIYLLYREKFIFARVEKHLRSADESTKKEGQFSERL